MGMCVDENGDVDLTRYLNSYNLESYDQAVGYAKAHGIKDIIFGPTGTPTHLAPDGYLVEENRAAYGELIADVINEMVTAYDVPITMTSIVNESNLGMNSAAEFAPIILALRARLDELGLDEIKIVAPEHANVNDGLESFYKTLRDSYPEAYAAVDYIAVHSYNMSLTNSFGNMLWNDGKAIISTEACVEGKAAADNTTNAASITARALNDMNNGTTLWTHFHAFGFDKDATSLVRYNKSTKIHETTASYDYIKLLSNNFTEGTVMRKSKLDGAAISYTYDRRKPKMTVAAGVDKNGKWNIAMVNNTDDERSFEEYGFATYPDTYMEVTLTVDELSDVDEKEFTVFGTHNNDTKIIKFVNGVAQDTIKVYPRELIMLTEVTDDTSKVIYNNTQNGKSYIRVNVDNAMTGVWSECAGGKLINAKLYEFTQGVNVVNETVSENADNIMIMSLDSMETLKPNMHKFSCDITKTAE